MSRSEETVATGAPPPSGPDRPRLSVFVSYSRTDSEFADQLVAALEAFGFATTIDRQGIHGAENWERRLGELILESDTVVFVLTPASAASEVCAWEVDRAVELKKRVVPVLVAPLGEETPHEHLRDLNYIFFYDEPSVPGSGFGHGLARLVAALSVDVQWTREHTRLGALATRWREGGRPPDLLLRGSELVRVQSWRDTKPPDAPDLTSLHRDFLQASEDAENARTLEERHRLEERQQALRQAEEAAGERAEALGKLARRTRIGLVGLLVLLIASVAASLFAYQQNQILKATERSVTSLLARAEEQEAAIRAASLRLREGMTLKIAKTDREVTTTEKWYRIATDYKLAIGLYRVQTTGSEIYTSGTGFLVKGGDLDPRWKDRMVFVTASHVAYQSVSDPPMRGEPDLSRASVVFPAIDESKSVKVESILFDSPYSELDFAVLSFAEPLPRGVVPVDLPGQSGSAETLREGVAVLHWTRKDGFALGFGHGLDPASLNRPAARDRLFFTHVTGGGSSGAPVFDADSGTLACLNVGASVGGPRPYALCVPMSKILAAIRSAP